MAAVFAALLLGALVPRPLLPFDSVDTATRRILLLHNPIHTDIAIPLDAAVLADFDFLLGAGIPADLPDARYLVFGWGGREFYINTPVWSELKAGPLFKGLTLDRSVMHVEVAGDIPEPQPVVTGHALSEAGYDRLLTFIRASFRSSPERGPIHIEGAAYGEFDAFFEANGWFNAVAGCNTWTATALREAGLRTGWWNPLPQSLAVSLSLHN